MSIDINLLKQLRETTFAPLKDCKDALIEANGDLQQAQEILKEKGVLKAGKRSDRETKEGIVKVVSQNGKIAGVKLLCETDFVAKNEGFIKLCDDILDKLLSENEFFLSKQDAPTNLSESLDVLVKEAVGAIGENMQLDDIILTNENGFVYNHPGNKVASIVFFEGANSDIAKEIALQVAAMNPSYLDFDSVPSDIISKMESQFRQELLDSGKPENILDQILKGKLTKALAEDVLLEQEYIRDGSKKIKNIIPEGFQLKSYIRLAVK
ncbi:MAG TPA: translation elongation factor Ts [Candidatus Absconditabacterales bacterium]|nr:translation elongation factor Ts [Candidatus Absconditabacterales bacterium]HOQ78907.1 translation elongation factor Ts [Candidatus Absconditabacterales bacterium]HPK27946.1 translation elongation factor Ts [Candidatus Absconditabacterales bacterium]